MKIPGRVGAVVGYIVAVGLVTFALGVVLALNVWIWGKVF